MATRTKPHDHQASMVFGAESEVSVISAEVRLYHRQFNWSGPGSTPSLLNPLSIYRRGNEKPNSVCRPNALKGCSPKSHHVLK